MILLFSIQMYLSNYPLSEGQLGDDAFYLLGLYKFRLCEAKQDPEWQDPRIILIFTKLKYKYHELSVCKIQSKVKVYLTSLLPLYLKESVNI